MRLYTPVWKTFTGVPVQGALKIMSARVRALTTLFGVVLIGGGVLLPSLAAAQSNNLDNCLHDTGDVAITACSAAIRENPRDADAYNGRGSAFVRKGHVWTAPWQELSDVDAAHHWGRELQALGHTVKLMPPSYVKAYLKRGKNDANDAAACLCGRYGRWP
jgi:hypothetical protein